MRERSPGRPLRCRSRGWYRLLYSGLVLLSACGPEPSVATGGLRVLVLDEPVGAQPVGSARVDLQGLAAGAFTNASGYAVFSNLPAGTYQVAAGMSGYCSTSVPATVAPNAVTEVTVTLCSGPGDGGSGSGDQISLTTPGTQIGLLVFDAAVGAGPCLHDRSVPGLERYPLGVNALPPGSTGGGGETCPTSVTIFTPSHGLYFSNDPALLPWTSGLDNISLTLPPLLKVPLAIWVAPGLGSVTMTQDIRDIHLKQAREIFHPAAAGIALTGDEATGGEPTVVDIPTDSPGASLFIAGAAGCEVAAQIMAQPTIYQADKINVYYVATITGRGTASSGYYCYIEGARPILFIRTFPNFSHTLAHELGHALGLLEPNWGHTHGNLPGFLTQPGGAPRNFMAYGATGDVARPIYATLGQAFRMNLSPLSWINLPGSGGTSLRQRAGLVSAPVGCPCAAAETSEDCPLLTLTTLAPDHLTSGLGWELACSVAPAAAVVSLCVGESRAVRASFATTVGGVTLPAKSGDIIWVSDNPTVAVLNPAAALSGVDGSGAGWAEQKIVGGLVGSATVTLFAGGPSASGQYSVTVVACG